MAAEGSARRRARHVTLFLDVDGVLNSYPVTGFRFLRERRKKVRAWNFELHYRPSIVRALDRLCSKRLVDIVWLSTWSHRCRTEIEPGLGFRRSYPIIPMPDDSYNRFASDPQTWWKAIAVEQWMADHPDDRVVWIDDDLAAPRTREHFAQAYPQRLLMIAPRFHRGLGEEHFGAIRDFTFRRRASTPETTQLLTTDAHLAARDESASHTGQEASGQDASGHHASGGPSAEAPAGPDPDLAYPTLPDEPQDWELEQDQDSGDAQSRSAAGTVRTGEHP